MLIINARLITHPQTTGWLHIENGRIASLGTDAPPHLPNVEILDAANAYLLPGFIDVHVHGGAGSDTMDATPEALHTMSAFYARHGVTGYLATTWTDSRERIQAALENVARIQQGGSPGAALLGVHLEGPYLNPDRSGAQNTQYIRHADEWDEVTAFLDSGVIKLASIAPEYAENHRFITACVQQGITVSAAHTAATYDDMMRAVELGLRHSTHTFNAMTGLHHREPGTVGAVLSLPQIRCELIADNIHVHPAVMRVLWLAKGADGVILITDAMRAAGMPDGDYPEGDRIITVHEGAARLPDGTLAGSILTMDAALRNFMRAVDRPLHVVWQVTSRNAAHALNLQERKGELAPGYDADLVLLNDALEVQTTIVGGVVVYNS